MFERKRGMGISDLVGKDGGIMKSITGDGYLLQFCCDQHG